MNFFGKKLICGIDLQEDKLYLCLAQLERDSLKLVKEIHVNPLFKDNTFLPYFKENAELIDQILRAAERELGTTVVKTFLVLPDSTQNCQISSAAYKLKQEKRLSQRDIEAAKKSLEDSSLNWDQICVHHLVKNYQLDKKNWSGYPIDQQASQLELNSLLVWVRDKMYKDVRDVFRNINRSFGGFVHCGLAGLSSHFNENDYTQDRVCLHIGYKESFWVGFRDQVVEFGAPINFGLNSVIEAMTNNFEFSFDLSQEIMQRYINFTDACAAKEIAVKTEQGNINLSLSTLNDFLVSHISQELKKISLSMPNVLDKPTELVITGRFNDKTGFESLVQPLFPGYVLRKPLVNGFVSLGFGAAAYGVSRWLETSRRKRESLGQMATRVYKEYF